MLEELSKSFKAILYDRVVSPLSGTFILSWLVINWKAMALLLLDDAFVEIRIKNIEALYSDNWFMPLAVYPLISAVILIFIYPYPSKLAYWFSKRRTEELKKIKQEIEKKTLLTREESDELRIQMEKSKTYASGLLKEKDDLIAALNRKIESLEAENPISTKKPEVQVTSAKAEDTDNAPEEKVRKVGGYRIGPGADLRKADLKEADLTSANLRKADLWRADLREANLTRADLAGANLIEAYLRGVRLREATLGGANLRGVDLSGADLTGADLTGADLAGADLTKVICDPEQIFKARNWDKAHFSEGVKEKLKELDANRKGAG
ncbi:MAG: pentapeptide repeat-containing protein [Candidatus Desulfatibia sp.]|uniref:pentapeptide repeat-containing protein n=1 Tax=Candidatus Desulfatibia sp. TaxID=3101189 RepID=UPI002F328D8A